MIDKVQVKASVTDFSPIKQEVNLVFFLFSRGVRKSVGRGAEKEFLLLEKCHLAVALVVWWQQTSHWALCIPAPNSLYCCSSLLLYCGTLKSSCGFFSAGNALGLPLWGCVESSSFPHCFCSIVWGTALQACSHTFACSCLGRSVLRANSEWDTKNSRHFIEWNYFKINIAICIN